MKLSIKWILFWSATILAFVWLMTLLKPPVEVVRVVSNSCRIGWALLILFGMKLERGWTVTWFIIGLLFIAGLVWIPLTAEIKETLVQMSVIVIVGLVLIKKYRRDMATEDRK